MTVAPCPATASLPMATALKPTLDCVPIPTPLLAVAAEKSPSRTLPVDPRPETAADAPTMMLSVVRIADTLLISFVLMLSAWVRGRDCTTEGPAGCGDGSRI